MQNLFAGASAEDWQRLPEELVEVLARGKDVRIERIVSTGQASPPGFWYDQPESEWVALLAGEAELRLENREQPLRLRPGDFVEIPAHCKHRVEWTAANSPTVWLAVFFQDSPRAADAGD